MADYSIRPEVTEHIPGFQAGGVSGSVPDGMVVYEAEGVYVQTSNYEDTVYVGDMPVEGVGMMQLPVERHGMPPGMVFEGTCYVTESLSSDVKSRIRGALVFYDAEGNEVYTGKPGIKLVRMAGPVSGTAVRLRLVGLLFENG